MVDDYWIMYLELDDNMVSILDGQKGKFSKKDLRRAYNRFRGDGDVIGCNTKPADRFFKSRSEMIAYFKNRGY